MNIISIVTRFTVQSKLIFFNLKPTVNHPGLSFRDKFGTRLQYFLDTNSVCGNSQVLFDNLLHCIITIDLRKS
jgi:hypothetical protein